MNISHTPTRKTPLIARWLPTESAPNACSHHQPCDEILLENKQLKARITELENERPTVALDPEQNEISVHDLNSNAFHVHHLRLTLDGIRETMAESTSLQSLLSAAESGQLPNLSAPDFREKELRIESMKVTLPGKTLAASSEIMTPDALKKHEIKELEIEPKDGDILHIEGKVDKLVDIPFEVEGKLGVEDGNRFYFELTKSKAFGFIPVPKLVLRILARIADKEMEELGVEQEGNRFLMDADDFLPPNVKLHLTRLGTENGDVVLEAGEPAKERAPSTLTILS